MLPRTVAALMIFGLCLWWSWREKQTFMTGGELSPSVILDAGHGGEDGGAVSERGVKESGINLEIVLKMDQILGLIGEAPLLLRQEDISLHHSSAVTLREKKVSDLKNRAEIVNAHPGAVLVSIHQNSYPDSKYKGTQVFYGPTGGSEELAKKIQCAVVTCLQKENGREIKRIPESVYLMNHVKNKAVLIECGFLTNSEEEALLQRAEYQRKLAVVLSCALESSL